MNNEQLDALFWMTVRFICYVLVIIAIIGLAGYGLISLIF